MRDYLTQQLEGLKFSVNNNLYVIIMDKLEKKIEETKILESIEGDVKHYLSPAFLPNDSQNMNTF